MGRRKKSANAVEGKGHVVAEAVGTIARPSVTAPPAISEQDDVDPYTIPLHSRQAAFAILWLLVSSFAMFTLPFGAFFGMRHLLADRFQIEGFPNTCASVLAAVVTVNVIIMLYAFRGFREVEEEDRERSKQKTK
uniref:Vacuolar ATPase assembly integral membrane protein VMA21 homolog n=1 Tax=Anopheles christyi TaxID=43041 RepID=A0A182JWT9_9DIPT